MGNASRTIIDDTIILSAGPRWRKVAIIVVKTRGELERKGMAVSLGTIGRRVAALVESGRLEGAGDLSNWRHSEVRLPPHA